jgi:hypothetical protein
MVFSGATASKRPREATEFGSSVVYKNATRFSAFSPLPRSSSNNSTCVAIGNALEEPVDISVTRFAPTGSVMMPYTNGISALSATGNACWDALVPMENIRSTCREAKVLAIVVDMAGSPPAFWYINCTRSPSASISPVKRSSNPGLPNSKAGMCAPDNIPTVKSYVPAAESGVSFWAESYVSSWAQPPRTAAPTVIISATAKSVFSFFIEILLYCAKLLHVFVVYHEF